MVKQPKSKTDHRPIVHLVCQAHIDPVWMWPWQEGAADDYSLNLNPYEITTLQVKRGRKGMTIKPCELLEA